MVMRPEYLFTDDDPAPDDALRLPDPVVPPSVDLTVRFYGSSGDVDATE
jgi:hypothetical protein